MIEKRHELNKNTYLITRDPTKPKKKVYVKEDDVLKEISEVFKSLQFPKEMLDEITKHLRITHEAEKEYHEHKLKELHKQKETSTLKLNKLVDMVLKGLVSEELYETKKQEITKELNSAKTEIEIYEKANDDFKEVLITAFYLASKSYDLFNCSKTEEKRKLISFVFFKHLANRQKARFYLA